jgi:hypothetical protein
MSKNQIKKFFPGANTSRGFFSLYHYIIPQDTTRIFVIKGGPGVGKSTFMKKICQTMTDRGFQAEWQCCSSDNGSIDGVVFPQIGVAMLDGTAPHVVDPKNPGAVDEIIHLGDYWNESMLRGSKEEILKENRRVGRLFGIGYYALQEAFVALTEWKSYISEAQNWSKVNETFANTWEEIMSNVKPNWRVSPLDRHLFAWAISPQGKTNFIDTLLDGVSKMYVIKGEPGSGKSSFITKFGQQALEWGMNVEFYHNTLNPDDVDGIIIRELGIAMFSSGGPFIYRPENFSGSTKLLDFGVFLKPEVLSVYAAEIKAAGERCLQHIDRAVSFVAKAKDTHDHMETYYIPAMDFAAIEKRRTEIETRILGYAEELAKAATTASKTLI